MERTPTMADLAAVREMLDRPRELTVQQWAHADRIIQAARCGGRPPGVGGGRQAAGVGTPG